LRGSDLTAVQVVSVEERSNGSRSRKCRCISAHGPPIDSRSRSAGDQKRLGGSLGRRSTLRFLPKLNGSLMGIAESNSYIRALPRLLHSAGEGGAPMWLSMRFGPRRAVEGTVAQHRKQHVAAAPCESDKGLVMALPLADLARVVRPGDGIAQGGEGRQEQRALQLLVSASRRQLATDGRSRAPGDWRKIA
jgi:hypothetical protein